MTPQEAERLGSIIGHKISGIKSSADEFIIEFESGLSVRIMGEDSFYCEGQAVIIFPDGFEIVADD